MKIKLLTLLAILLLFPAIVTAKAPAKKHTLKVLYVGGSPDFEVLGTQEVPANVLNESATKRMKSFEKFLKEYFTSVTVIKAEDYTQAMSDKYDVTIMDGRPKPIVPAYQNRAKGVFLSEGFLTQDFSRPMLAIGVVNERIGRRIGKKNDWYCLCLFSDAHSWRAEHEIFKGPFPVKMTVVDKPTPEPIYNYPHQLGGTILEKLPMWKVQTYDFEDESFEGKRIGLVARPGGYEDSPEAEYISGGVTTKSPFAVALGRHGNFFHWGFAASPDNMTDEAKPVLANAIVYISKFAGQTPIARKYNDRAPTRNFIRDRQQFMSREAYELNVKSIAVFNEARLKSQEEVRVKQARGETLTQREEQELNFPQQPIPTYEQHLRQQAGNLFAQFGTDIAAYIKYFDENYNYFYHNTGFNLDVDEDAKSLGIPNNDKRILDEAIKLFESGRDTDKGRRILERYTLVDFSTPAEWRRWYNTYKDKFFFTESGGWVFLINSREPAMNDYRTHQIRSSVNRMAIDKTSDTEPIAIAADAVVLQDGSCVLNVKINIHSGYYTYDHIGRGDIFIPTAVEVFLPDGFSKKGNLKRPHGQFLTQNGTTVFRDTIVFSQEFTGNGTGEVKVKVTYQCCDSNICFPPVTKEITVTL
jgi:hypothetical protein